MKKLKFSWCFLAMIIYPAIVFSFSFSEYEEQETKQEKHQQAKTQKKINHLLSIACKEQLAKKKIAVIIGQENGRADYDLMFMEVNSKLQKLGLKTYSQKEITAQIAKAEMDAFLSNDMDAAADAASKLKADFVLRGVIQARTRYNRMVRTDEISINMAFTLVDGAGRIISNVMAQGEAFSGQNTLTAALALVREKADMVVAQLYNNYCRSAKSLKNSDSDQQTTTEPKVESVKDF